MPIADAGPVGDTQARHDWIVRYGPTLQVVVSHYAQDGAVPLSNVEKSVYGLVDTGATASCIDDAVAKELALPAIDRCVISGANGTSEHTVYLGQVNIPSLGLTTYGSFTGVRLTDGGLEQAVILGRTFLQSTVMVYDGRTGLISISI